MSMMAISGVLLGLFSIIAAQLIEGNAILTLINIPALVIVLGGSIAAIIVQTPKSILKQAIHISSWLFNPPNLYSKDVIDLLALWSKQVKKDGLIVIENQINRLKDPFLRKAIELAISGIDKDAILSMMEHEIDTIESRDLHAAKVFESLGGYTPTLGIMGAILGLMQVLQNLTDPSLLGHGIAVAFVATIYGVGFANLLFIPISNRFKSFIFKRTRTYEMFLVGLESLLNQDSPQMVRQKMRSFVYGRYS